MSRVPMFQRMVVPALAATLMLGACDDSPSQPSEVVEDDYALVMFGEPGAALEGMMGAQDAARPFDGRSGMHRLPDELRLSAEQITELQALRTAFLAEHAAEVDALQAIFVEARAARQAGATREEVRAILMEGRPIALALRVDLLALHQAILGVLTPAQREWLREHRPRLPTPIVPRRG